ncbi:coiled-coil domain-containing protein 149 [Pieris rapae]|uniref:coiled-coil domain-containing protein 149 n=1 Tax=Pieris rapae TaxID=64459 RepID=UPI001E27EB4A|nr:coiled-coil domain-containing protein 149 [Pieris rapae]
MFVNKLSKVQFSDQQLDDYVLENSVLKSKLQSKNDALSIMSKELDKSCMERDRFKTLVEQLKCSKIVLKDTMQVINKYAPTNTISGSEILAKTKEHNNMLKLEVETLRSKLDDANGDILALRKQLQKNGTLGNIGDCKSASPVESIYSLLEYEQLVQELEKVQKKCKQMQMDYRATLDEKEELVSDRDYYKNKVQRLNHQISFLLTNRMKPSLDSNMAKPVVDIDALVMENKYLHESITQLQVEKEIMKRTLNKYKTLLDSRSKNDAINFRKGFADVMTQQQVREYLNSNTKSGLKKSSLTELKSLCLGLFEALNDKSIALQHQRKTNQVLANRISELEKTMESWCNGQKCVPIFPSQLLMEEFLNDSRSIKSDDREKVEREPSDNYSDSEEGNANSESFTSNRCLSKIVLPEDLQELVKEALAELKA